MTLAASATSIADYEDRITLSSYLQQLNDIGRGVREHSGAADSSLSKQPVIPSLVIGSHSGTADYEVTLFQYGEDSNALIIVDFAETEGEFSREHEEVIRLLRANGRPVLASKLITMLRNVREDPEQHAVSIVSLQDMARLLVAQEDFADPFIGPDRRGIIHAQWRIIGNGILVVSFLGYGEILLVAQAGERPDDEVLDISTRGSERVILGEFGHLVPRRY